MNENEEGWPSRRKMRRECYTKKSRDIEISRREW